jgi:hypothetical protein
MPYIETPGGTACGGATRGWWWYISSIRSAAYHDLKKIKNCILKIDRLVG